jgi:hypothetical protein
MMKSLVPLVILGIASASAAFGQDARYETVTANAPNATFVTNTISVADYETGELISLGANNVGAGGSVSITFTRDGLTFGALAASSSTPGTTVRGPATFTLVSYNDGGQSYSGYMTVKITPVSFPPNQTLIVPPGTNQVQISLEASTNLVNWATATNGVYGGNTNTAQFFRIHMTNLQP